MYIIMDLDAINYKPSMLMFSFVCVIGVLQVCRAIESKYGSSCNSDLDCLTSIEETIKCVDPFVACFKRKLDYEGWIGSEACPMVINTTKPIPQPACIGVPEAVQNVQLNVYKNSSNGTLTVLVTWTPSPKYVGPVTYHVEAIGDQHAPSNPYYISTKAPADEDTFHVEYRDLPGNLNYTFNVTVISAVGHSSLHSAVRLTNTKPYFTRSVLLTKDQSYGPRSFDVHLCSSCLTDPSQGQVEAIVIIVCDISKSLKCQSSYVDPVGYLSAINVTQAEDIKLFHSWAFAKGHNFDVPFRTSPDDFHEKLREERSPEIIYTVGSGYCMEADTQAFCNGQLTPDSDFMVAIIVCNDVGCEESKHERFTTKMTDSDGDDQDATVVALAILLVMTLIACIAMAAYIMWTRRSTVVT